MQEGALKHPSEGQAKCSANQQVLTANQEVLTAITCQHVCNQEYPIML